MNMSSETRRNRVFQGARVSPAETARRLRVTLVSPEFRTENQRKAALRRILHESVAGLDATSSRIYLDELRARFPDRVYEATNRLLESETNRRELESRVESLAMERDNLKARLKAADVILAGLLEAPGATKGKGADQLLGTLIDADGIRRLAPAVGSVIRGLVACVNARL